MTREVRTKIMSATSRKCFGLLAAAILVLPCAACDDSPAADADADVDTDVDADADADADLDEQPCTRPCDSACCEAGQVCVRDACIDEVNCAGGEPCQGDSYCEGGLCVPFGPPFQDFDEGCSREVEPLDSFEPEVQCEWPGDYDIETPSSTSVRVAPVVADLEGDGVPEILFVSHRTRDQVRIRAIRGNTCAPVWTMERPYDESCSLAVADLDGDGGQEVCGGGARGDAGRVPFCLASDGTLLWEGHDETGPFRPGGWDSGLAIANVDGVGAPELVVGLWVFDGETGELLRGRASPRVWTLPSLADLEGDGHLEALTGAWVADLAVDTPPVDLGGWHGYTAVAELSAAHDGPETVVVNGNIKVQALDGTVIYEQPVPGGGGGPPTVADLDGDGRAELACAGSSYFSAFDLDCTDIPASPEEAGFCAAENVSDGVLWSQPTHEMTSGATGSSVFDFEGDGPVEVVYADECWARVYDGATGAVKFSAPHDSATAWEYPVVADADGDFYSEIVVPHEGYLPQHCPDQDSQFPGAVREAGRTYAGITVYRDRQDRWAPSRPLWSQHTEHLSNRFDDGTVPLAEVPSWTTHNSYRQAHPREGGTANDSPDLTVGNLGAPECNTSEATQLLSATVCNRGTLPVAPGVDVSFHVDSPGGEVVCSATTGDALEPGACEDVSCLWEGITLDTDHEVHAVVDSDDEAFIAECHEDNNTATEEVRCPPIVF
jgi:hypothetical protein